MRRFTQDRENGFTLIELMLVIAIIGVLAALSVSVYQTYTVRAQVAEAINMVAHAKAPIIDAFKNSGRPPATRVEAGFTATATDTRGQFVIQVDIVDGRVDVTMGNSAHAEITGDVISFTPYMLPGGGIIWRCGAAPAPGGGAVLLTDGMGSTTAYLAPTLETRYMPSICRP